MSPRLSPLAFIQAFYPWECNPPPAQDDEQIDYFAGMDIYAAEMREVYEMWQTRSIP